MGQEGRAGRGAPGGDTPGAFRSRGVDHAVDAPHGLGAQYGRGGVAPGCSAGVSGAERPSKPDSFTGEIHEPSGRDPRLPGVQGGAGSAVGHEPLFLEPGRPAGSLGVAPSGACTPAAATRPRPMPRPAGSCRPAGISASRLTRGRRASSGACRDPGRRTSSRAGSSPTMRTFSCTPATGSRSPSSCTARAGHASSATRAATSPSTPRTRPSGSCSSPPRARQPDRHLQQALLGLG